MKWLGLRVRIAVVFVLAVAGACTALTLTTVEWAATNHEEQLGQAVEDAAGVDAAWLLAKVEKDPAARRMADLGIDRPHSDEFGGDGVLLPIESPAAGGQFVMAEQYVFWEDEAFLVDQIPECLTEAALASRGEESSSGGFSQWHRICGGYAVGYALAVAAKDNAIPMWLVIRARDLSGADDPIPDLRKTLITYSAVIGVAGLLVAGLLASIVARPLSTARWMAESVAEGNLAMRIPIQGRDEVARMSTAVNTMADRLTGQISELEQANEAQQRFVSDVAHELRTPTAALLASAEALEHPETRDEAAVLIAPQLRRLAGLTEDLLEISRMDAGRAHVEPSRIDLMDLVNEVIDDCGAPSDVSLVGCFPLEVSTDPARLRVIVRNLVANALQHGAPPVTISAEANDASVTVSVTDEGMGVPPALRERVFDRFVRGDEARHGSSSGLGLAIAAENARLLGGTITLDADGRTFLLTLPA
jgi:signal transduction histidine kinase